MPNEWVDFKRVKEAVYMTMVLDHYGIKGLNKSGDELRGQCPFHKGPKQEKTLRVNLRKNAFRCFSEGCGARGNVLDFVAAMEKCSVRDAGLKLQAWFEVRDHDNLKHKTSEGLSLTCDTITSLTDLVAEVEIHTSKIRHHASLLEAKTVAVKELVTKLQEV